MAVRYAVANGNWNAGATWNGGTVPQSGDFVYLNGKTINGVVNLNLGNGTISNKANADYGVNNGGILDYGSAQTAINIVANIEVGNTYIFILRATNVVVNILGNIVGGKNTFNCLQNATFTITGNCYDVYWWENSTTLEVTINGNLTNIRANKMTQLTVNGNYTRTLTGGTFNPTAFWINGNIKYESVNNYVGLTDLTKLTILNPDTFTWKDITEPRSNPFIIVTDAEMNNRQQYPPEDVVKQGVEYVWGEKVGTYLPDYPPESVVLQGYEYDNGDKVGSMSAQAQVGCVTKEDVREGVPLIGMGEVGTLVVPSVDDVREGVVFDNGSVGTLIVQGGGDRLRIADFGYYTNAQSDTYIVDLTEQDKPKFAVAEERVLIEMFPDLDLDNIPDKYFDDLFIKYLKYRLIVEYYRTAGINSTFTPSEPTTEIVNYQNVRNEVWLNSANIYLKAWAKKYPESIMKPQRILL